MAPSRRTARQAFTLIELLVVIAIIAILTAILLPVFASVREGARQGTSISNMKDIQQKMEQFKLDNHRYPDVLFGYAVPNTAMKSALGTVQAYDTAHGTHKAAIYFPGLYPAYIKDPEEFTDPNNTVNSSDTGKYTGLLKTNIIVPCSVNADETLTGAATSPCTQTTANGVTTPGSGSVVQTTRNFYLADAYDSSPTVTGTNQINDPTANASYAVRYQLAHEGTACSATNVPVGCDPNVQATVTNRDGTVAAYQPYTHQLRWQNPPSDTVITATSYHVKNADKVLVMFESGAVKKVTGKEFATGIAGQTNSDPANFWQITP